MIALLSGVYQSEAERFQTMGDMPLWFTSVGGLTVDRCLGAQSASASSLCSCSV